MGGSALRFFAEKRIEVGLICGGALTVRAGNGSGHRFRRQCGRSGRLLVARDEPRDATSTLPGGGALDRPLLPAILADQGDRLPPAFSGAWAAAVGRAAVKSLALSAGAGDVMRGWRGG